MMRRYRRGTVHRTPPGRLFSSLPPAILTLAAALPKKEREVLVYFISYSCANFCDDHHENTPSAATSGGSKGGATDHPVCFACYCFRPYSSYWASGGFKGGATDHPVCFACNCFECYSSYWDKWDSSPNRLLIHEIIDAFDESLSRENWEKEKLDRGSVMSFVMSLAIMVWSLRR